MDDRNPIVRIGDSLRELNRVFFHVTRRDCEEFGITPIQFLALRVLKQYPRIGLNELSELMHSGASTVSGVVDRLVQAGFIERERLEKDRRAVELNLSSAGNEMVEQMNDRILDRLSPLLTLSEEDIGHLLRVQGKIIDLLQNGEDK
ncbi:MarR family winged helix-turn-helix transcriptional regulator [Cohnella caldifontis]|uniref:MarR family winged helix-turn-helix transcriptional regulator n=1 Tax=Cohnella caldifontis TaxID=3027471 RepID=UPI0023EB245B|nr:MarR family transcriptional regulator [Cohnella sp. YIM B05605]